MQQGMLKLLEGAEVEVPVGANSKNAMVPLDNVNTRIFCLSAAVRSRILRKLSKRRLSRQTSIGFSAELKDKYDNDKNLSVR